MSCSPVPHNFFAEFQAGKIIKKFSVLTQVANHFCSSRLVVKDFSSKLEKYFYKAAEENQIELRSGIYKLTTNCRPNMNYENYEGYCITKGRLKLTKEHGHFDEIKSNFEIIELSELIMTEFTKWIMFLILLFICIGVSLLPKVLVRTTTFKNHSVAYLYKNSLFIQLPALVTFAFMTFFLLFSYIQPLWTGVLFLGFIATLFAVIFECIILIRNRQLK